MCHRRCEPSTTTLKYTGTSGGTLLTFDGWYCAIRRLTFEGAGTAGTGLLQHGNFSTAVEFSDLWFQNMGVGISLGANDSGQAEHFINRCHFTNCTTDGIQTWDWNSMDEWIWYCLFQNCAKGVFNEMGNYHVYNSVFLGSTIADCYSNNNMAFTISGNTSIGSNMFIGGGGTTMYLPSGTVDTFVGDPIMICHNSVYDTSNPLGPLAVASMGGSITAMDNLFASPAGASGGVLQWDEHSKELWSATPSRCPVGENAPGMITAVLSRVS